jgi:hypothetical protein
VRLMNVTEFTNNSLQAVLDEILEFGGWDAWPNGRIVMRHPKKGTRVRRAKFNWRHDNNGYLIEVTLSRSCTGNRLGQDLHWWVSKDIFKDDPGRYLHMHDYPDLVKKTKVKQGQEPARDRMQENRDKAQEHVDRLKRELKKLEQDKKRKQKLVKKWQSKVKECDRRLRYRPKANARAAKKRHDEKAWRERVQKKAEAMKEELDGPA